MKKNTYISTIPRADTIFIEEKSQAREATHPKEASAVTRSVQPGEVAHGHFRRNGRPIGFPSILVEPGDVIQARPREGFGNLYRGNVVERLGVKT